jgi:NAD-dependent deacetylase
MNKRLNKLEDLKDLIEIKEDCRIVVFTGAGMSAESGINTFRDNDGLWANHRLEDVASIEAWHKDQDLVLEFYNQRRRQLLSSSPNGGHLVLAKMQGHFTNLQVITQNVDDLHERAGQANVLHLHGQLRMSRSTGPGEEEFLIEGSDLKRGDLCPRGYQLRPNIVWFGEMVPAFDEALEQVAQCDLLIVVGSSLVVYPAAGLLNYIRPEVKILLIDPQETNFRSTKEIYHYPVKAAQGLNELARLLMQ